MTQSDPEHEHERELEQEDEQGRGERLVRFLAHAGVASRRHAEELIAAGRVQVNGATVTTQGTRIHPARDVISVDGRAVSAPTQHVYVLLHKPVGYVSTVYDPQYRRTVLDLLPEELRRLRLYPVGRLDLDTSGLLLLTNDGDFALRMTHPRYSMQKHYEALVEGCPGEAALNALRRGVEIVEDNGQRHKTTPAKVRLLRRERASQSRENCWLALTIHEGRKRQVRRMLAAVGHPVLQLVRTGIGPLSLNNLPSGKWRYLTEKELEQLS
ncbi:MAG TPA: pseudouridine synthase [Ktedonobacteraceae bacterium]|nr:pseudouridine synthase [Ktedonobacteraceae bacterium]